MRHPLPVSVRALFLLLASTVLASCSARPPSASPPDPAGTWLLESVNGMKVPCTVQHGGATVAIKSGVFVFRADRTCTSRVVFSPPAGGEVAREVQAKWTRQGSSLTMDWEGAGTNGGTLEGNTFTMNNEGMIFTYRR